MREDYGEGAHADSFLRVWPNAMLPLSWAIPAPLRAEYDEAKRCFGAKAYTASAVMVGRVLEGVCADHKITRKPLSKALEAMRDEGLIDQRLYDWTRELRFLRNEAAHYTGHQVDRADASDALDLCEALMDYMYVLAAKFDAFRERRSKQVATAAGDSVSELPDAP